MWIFLIGEYQRLYYPLKHAIKWHEIVNEEQGKKINDDVKGVKHLGSY